jgi:hypothetical protein
MRLPTAIAELLAFKLSWLLLRACVPLGKLATQWRLAIGRPRSVWGITPILTLSLKARCDRALGIRSSSLVLSQYYTTSRFDLNLSPIATWVAERYPQLYKPFCRIILCWALVRFDFFNYFADRGILPPPLGFGADLEELRAIKAAGKRLFVYAYGADVRTRELTLDLDGWNICRSCPDPGRFCVCDDERGRAIVAVLDTYVTATIAMADMPRYIPGSRVFDYWPIDTLAIPTRPCSTSGLALRIAHAPNNADFKGTRFLSQAVERLRDEGHEIELVRVEGVPNAQVLQLFASCDVVADQFVIGNYGYTTLEAMALGRPVLCYIRDPTELTGGAECPIINTDPDRLYSTLKWCLANRAALAKIGGDGRRYVERYHSIAAVATRLADLYVATANLPPALSERIRRRAAALADR